MAFILGHRGLSGQCLEDSIEAFEAALKAGMDGFSLGVQPTCDAVCVVMRDEELGSTTSGHGILRKMKYGELPSLKNGETVPRLLDVLELPAKFINIELIGEPGWQNALAAVEASDSLKRVIFSSLEHSEILQLWAACPQAGCGFIWERDEADALTEDEISGLPKSLRLHVPVSSANKRPDFWKRFADRLVIWDARTYEHVASIGFEPFGCIVDSK